MKGSSDAARVMLSAALEMEKKGKAFYKKAVAACKNAPGREIFKGLMEDEDIHIERIQALFNSMSETQGWTDAWKSTNPVHKDLGTVFRDMAKRYGPKVTADAGDMGALDVGINFERTSVEFYETHLRKASGTAEKAFLEAMVTEEKSHHRILQDARLYLADPASWLREREKSGLDGG